MPDASDLRAKAEQCRRIAGDTRNPRLSRLLQSLADEFIEAAEQIDASGGEKRRQG